MTLPPLTTALSLVLRLGIAAVLIVAGWLKLQDPAAFATEIANYRLWPGAAPHLAVALPSMEMVLGLGLLALPRAWRNAATVATLALFVTFLGAVGSAYFRKIDIACGCFGGGGEAITVLTLFRNLGLVAAACSVLLLDRRR